MKRNLVCGFLTISLLSGISAWAVTGRKMAVSAGAAAPAAGPVKSIGIGGIFAVKKKAAKKAFAAAANKSVAPAAAVSTEFVLGQVYVYPNPAKGGAVPVFHIETGIADSVKVMVYSVSGRQVHEYTMTSQPQIITANGNTAYAYEYPWRGHIASGVYYYVMEAEKAGRKLKKSGKFAVVR